MSVDKRIDRAIINLMSTDGKDSIFKKNDFTFINNKLMSDSKLQRERLSIVKDFYGKYWIYNMTRNEKYRLGGDVLPFKINERLLIEALNSIKYYYMGRLEINMVVVKVPNKINYRIGYFCFKC